MPSAAGDQSSTSRSASSAGDRFEQPAIVGPERGGLIAVDVDFAEDLVPAS